MSLQRGWIAVFGVLGLAACASEPALPVARGTPSVANPTSPAAAAVPAEQPRGRLVTGAEYRRLVFGNTLVRALPNGSRLVIHTSQDGRQVLQLTGVGGRSATDRGEVMLQGDEVCSRWTRIGGGRPTCFRYYEVDGDLVAMDTKGEFAPARFELRPGNSERI